MIQREEILGKAQALLLSRLQERSVVDIPAIGLFQPLFHPEYILEGEEGRLLVPPRISLSYQPAEYLLNAKHYTTLDHQPPSYYFASDFISNLSDLHSWDEAEVAEVLTATLKELLEGLFKGRRVTLLELGDLFVTEEAAGVLLLNFVSNPVLLLSLNAPFSVYKETKLRADIDLSGTEVRQSRTLDDTALQYAIQQPEPISVSEPEPIPTPEIELTPIVEEPLPVREEKKRSNTWLVWLILALLLIVGGYLYMSKRPAPPATTPAVVPADTVIAKVDTIVVEEPAPLAPLDTIAVPKGGSLAAVAREYYNNALYWVYVYIANADSIPDPNNLQPGQTLVVPPLEWYTLNSDPAEADKEAKAWAPIILNGRFTSYEAQRPQLVIQP